MPITAVTTVTIMMPPCHSPCHRTAHRTAHRATVPLTVPLTVSPCRSPYRSPYRSPCLTVPLTVLCRQARQASFLWSSGCYQRHATSSTALTTTAALLSSMRARKAILKSQSSYSSRHTNHAFTRFTRITLFTRFTRITLITLILLASPAFGKCCVRQMLRSADVLVAGSVVHLRTHHRHSALRAVPTAPRHAPARYLTAGSTLVVRAGCQGDVRNGARSCGPCGHREVAQEGNEEGGGGGQQQGRIARGDRGAYGKHSAARCA
jgi:hypothetical protein